MRRVLVLTLMMLLFLAGLLLGRRLEHQDWEGRLERIAAEVPDCIDYEPGHLPDELEL